MTDAAHCRRHIPHHPHMDLCKFGHIASAPTLAAAGWTRARLARAMASGSVQRLRRGVYGCSHLDSALADAAAVGGALTCVSVLRPFEVWTGHDSRTHIQVAPHAAARPRTGMHLHWEEPRFAMATPWMSSRQQALWQAIRCLDEEHAIAAMESAMRKKFLTERAVRSLGEFAPERLQGGIRQLISISGSGNETVVRRRLLRVGYRVEPQGHVPGLGHQDLVVEDCLGLEIDSREWHGEDRRADDYDRDLRSELYGRHVLRIRPAHIYSSWPNTLSVIDRAVRDAQRLRQR